MKKPFPDVPVRSPAELVQLKTKMEAFYHTLDIEFGGVDPNSPVPPSSRYTCDDCASAPVCYFTFDPYNTDGDCLASK